MTPPYQITAEILKLIAAISEKIGHINAKFLDKPSPILRKENRIKTIHSSLSIEGNNDFRNSILRAMQTMTPGRLEMDSITDSSKSDFNQSLISESSKKKLYNVFSVKNQNNKSTSDPISDSIEVNKNIVKSKLNSIQNNKQKIFLTTFRNLSLISVVQTLKQLEPNP
jgi:hypothetical protein